MFRFLNRKNGVTKKEKCLFFIVILFLCLSDTRLNTFPYLYQPFTRIQITLICLTVLVIVCISSRKISLRFSVIIAFLLRIFYFLFISILNWRSASHFISYIVITSIFPVIYIYINNSIKNPENTLNKILKISIIIIGVQTIACFLLLIIKGHTLYQIKLAIDIPIGISNTIASIAIMQMILAFFFLKNKLFVFISVVTLLFTISKGAFLAGFLTFMLCMLFDAIEHKRLSKLIKYTLLILITFFALNYFFSSYMNVYKQTIESVLQKNILSIDNGRTDLFNIYLKEISERPLFGYGLAIDTFKEGMAHNFLIQSMYFGGIIGTIIYFSPYAITYHYASNINNKILKKYKIGLMMLFIVTCLHGSIENVFFTVPSEFMLAIYWSLICKIQSSKEHISNRNI